MDKQNGETPAQPQAQPTPPPEPPEMDRVTVQCAHCQTQNQFEVEKSTSEFRFLCAGCQSEITWTR